MRVDSQGRGCFVPVLPSIFKWGEECLMPVQIANTSSIQRVGGERD